MPVQKAEHIYFFNGGLKRFLESEEVSLTEYSQKFLDKDLQGL